MRPKKYRNIGCQPTRKAFKPRGIPMRDLETVRLEIDELEALRLADYEGMHHELAGKHMGISRATFGRLIESARRKSAEALIQGKALEIIEKANDEGL